MNTNVYVIGFFSHLELEFPCVLSIEFIILLFIIFVLPHTVCTVLCTHLFALSSGCECNNHAQRCHFDQAVYEASGRRSGGLCEGCMHHTTGPKCDQCAPGYQPNPRSQMDHPDACIRKWFKLKSTWNFKLGPSCDSCLPCFVAARLYLQCWGDSEWRPVWRQHGLVSV